MPVLKTIGFGGTEIYICMNRPINFCNGEIILHYFTPSFSTKSWHLPDEICRTRISSVYQLFSLTELQKALLVEIFLRSR